MTEPNVALLGKTLAHIETNRELWYQSDWGQDFQEAEDGECGTKFCFAGWGVELSGGKFRRNYSAFTNRSWNDYGEVEVASLPPEIQEKLEAQKDHAGRVSTATAACALFGIDREDGNRLFSAGNTMGALRMRVQHIGVQARRVIERTPWHLVSPEEWEDDSLDIHYGKALCEDHELDDCLVQAYLDAFEPRPERDCRIRLILGGEKIAYESKGVNA